jgi:predicted DNA-binding transcriptional regulator AlpA
MGNALDGHTIMDRLLDELVERLAHRLMSRLTDGGFARMQAANEPQSEQGASALEVARVLGISERSVWRGVASGTIPSKKVGGRRVFFLRRLLAESDDEEVGRRAREILRTA